MLELLNLIFGVGREQLPSAAEILRVATIFNQEKTGTHSIYIGSAVPSSVYRKYPSRKKTGGSYSLYKSILVALGLLVLTFFLPLLSCLTLPYSIAVLTNRMNFPRHVKLLYRVIHQTNLEALGEI